MMKSGILLVMCASLTTASNLFPAPLFYTSSDCTGDTDPASALWSFPAKDNVAVQPFSGSDQFTGYAINTCMTDSSITYSVMLKIDTTACPNNGNNALQFSYWANSTTCEATPTSTTTLIRNTCVTTPLGSAKFTAAMTTSQICTIMNYRVAVQTGGLQTRLWQGNGCDLLPIYDMTATMQQQPCGGVANYTGCHATYDQSCVRREKPSYTATLYACNKVSNGWEMATATLGFTDDKCTTSDNSSPLNGLTRQFGYCVNYVSGGEAASISTGVKAPLTADIFCSFVQTNQKLSVDGYLTWDEFNRRLGNSAPAVHPVPLLVSLLVVVLTVLF